MRKKRTIFPPRSPEVTNKILNLFYRKKLRPGEKVIDNNAAVIAIELNVSRKYVDDIITRSLNKKTIMI